MKKEPLLQVSKRRNKAGWQERLLIRFIALLLALIVCGAVIVALVKMNPVDVYKAIWDGAMGSERRLWQTIRDTMVLLCISIGLAPAFKMKFWNIGAEGQILIGGACSAAVMIYAGDKMPTGLLLIVMFVASALGGMIWGMIPAVFKAHWNTNETLFTLMLNYVAMQVITYCIVFWENPKGSNTVGIINQATKAGWLPELFGQKYGWNVVIVLVLTVGMFIYLKYCKQGYEIAVVGESENTARYAGIQVKKVIVRTMAISGAICGIAGFVIVSGASHTISTATAGGRGFTAIIVAWLSKFNTFIMVAVSFGIVFMNQGAVQIATQYGLNENASDVLLGIILFFLAIYFAGKNSDKKKLTTRQLVFCAVAIALAFITSYLKIFKLPWGGSVTLCSMLFIVLIANWYGVGTGIMAGFAYGILQFIQEPYILSFFQVCCDYILAFAALGLAGLFAKQSHGLLKGYIIAVIARGAFHSLGGYLYWMSYMPDNFPKSLTAVYPILYNYSYLLAEGIITVIIISVPAVSKALTQVKRAALQ